MNLVRIAARIATPVDSNAPNVPEDMNQLVVEMSGPWGNLIFQVQATKEQEKVLHQAAKNRTHKMDRGEVTVREDDGQPLEMDDDTDGGYEVDLDDLLDWLGSDERQEDGDYPQEKA